jgi:preprotein translocase subunit SecG
MGGSDSGVGGRSRAKSNEEKLSRLTKILAAVFFIVTFIVNLIVLSKN